MSTSSIRADAIAGESAVRTEAYAARGVSKRFGGVQALSDVNFGIEPGRITALLGENGAGKSTLIKIMSGMMPPDSGTLEIGGQPVVIRSVRDAQALGTQTVHQELELAPPLSVAENLFMGRLPSRAGMLDRRRMMSEARDMLASFDLPIEADALVRDLPLAGQQMVEIARALGRDAKYLILDEPTAALPPAEVDALLKVLRSLAERGVGLVFVTHRLDEVSRVADAAVILRDGRRVAHLPRSDLDRRTMMRHILGRDLVEMAPRPRTEPATATFTVEGLVSDPELADLTFAASPGEVLGFFGLLGAGQSVIGDSLFGLRKAEARALRFAGRTGLPASPRDAAALGMGYVPADRKGAGLAMNLTIQENLALPAFERFAGFGWIRRDAMRRHARAMIEQYQIRCRDENQPVYELSGGNQQKVSFAKWQCRELALLFVDEPSRGVDVGARQELYEHLRRLSAAGKLVLFASSDPSEIVALADRVLVLRRGQVTAELCGQEINEHALIAAAV
jgi:ABC-type sugar transport system ATPase subunit